MKINTFQANAISSARQKVGGVAHDNNSRRTTALVEAANVKAAPEFLTAEGARQVFGICRTQLWELTAGGQIRSVCLRRPGAARGKRLYCAQSIRDFLNAAMNEGGEAA